MKDNWAQFIAPLQEHYMEKSRKYSSLRHKGYDYSQQGAYFITICTWKQISHFETLTAKQIVEDIWISLPNRFPTISLDEFTIMPNHLHFIIWLDPEDVGAQIDCAPLSDGATKSSSIGKGKQVDHSHPAIGQVIRSFKSQVTRKMRTSGITNFTWQRGYYDHIIRTEESLTRIRVYIRNNPIRWHLDRYNPDAEGIDEDAKALWEKLKNEDARTGQLN